MPPDKNRPLWALVSVPGALDAFVGRHYLNARAVVSDRGPAPAVAPRAWLPLHGAHYARRLPPAPDC